MHLQEVLILYFAKVTNLLKLLLNKICRVVILLSYNFNNLVTLAKYKVKSSWRVCRCIEARRGAFDM
jgi:hypothetical protein